MDKWINLYLDPDMSPWSELKGVKGYEAITDPEGGLYYSYGVWRSEEASCMIDNRPYFSAAQRLAIVKCIKKRAGEEFSLQDFIKNDVVKSMPTVSGNKSGINSAPFVPLAPPVIKHTYAGGTDSKDVILYEVVGGGHETGERDMDLCAEMWKFIQKY